MKKISPAIWLTVTILFILSIDTCAQTDSSLLKEMAGKATTFTYFDKMRLCSDQHDSEGASAHFIKVDPFYLIGMNVTPLNLDTFMKNYGIIRKRCIPYIQQFTSTYNTPRSDSYLHFQAMFTEDQDVRYKLKEPLNDLQRRVLLEQEMRLTDSVHFAFLNSYVKNYGWPSIADGSLFAKTIALHDHNRHSYYLPIIRKAVLAGSLPISFYDAINRTIFESGLTAEKITHMRRRIDVDVTELLSKSYLSDTTISKIELAISGHCPIKFVSYIYESPDSHEYEQYTRTNYLEVFNNNKFEMLVDSHNQAVKWPVGCKPAGRYFDLRRTQNRRKKLRLILVY